MRVFFLIWILLSVGFAREINVAAAANLSHVLGEIQKEFLSTHPQDKINISYSSSGKAYIQIMQGAPIDIFLSADEEFPHRLYMEGKVPDKEEVYAQGVLVLWSADPKIKITSLKNLTDKKIFHIAIPNPKLAPYGRAAKQSLEKSELMSIVSSKLVNATSISQAHQFVATRSAEVGFGAFSLIDKYNKNVSYILVDKTLYAPINQALVLTNYGKNNPLAIEFKDFILSAGVKKIFKKYGYGFDE
ncbi:molybdate ABC transporter substrate-binding protein [Helicobacter sp. 13S00477-4]|uniref:molybdate ABC transporter substrate-binding protein n=1 Tax=Helicobacter sp. 13S00477-4 TaxID=1905759 RepID=UPI000BA7B928|nr:molybdate ABC transporter substrate-binding protein [Helicobacter sp. 13S00477-4]PAF52526.1 molybdate ABC transporter substrate-binding protein [Helicobacter sp. 13S00477-4]